MLRTTMHKWTQTMLFLLDHKDAVLSHRSVTHLIVQTETDDMHLTYQLNTDVNRIHTSLYITLHVW